MKIENNKTQKVGNYVGVVSVMGYVNFIVEVDGLFEKWEMDFCHIPVEKKKTVTRKKKSANKKL